MMYALFDEGGFSIGFYSEEVHGPRIINDDPNPDCKIPAEAVAISNEQWQELLSHPGARKWHDGGVVEYAPPPPSFDEAKAAKLASAAERRWQIETGGIVVGGAPIATDRESQSLIDGAYQGALRHPETVIEFKGLGGWVTLDATTMIAIGDAVFFHVQACFKREKELATAINAAGNQAALDLIDISTGWPPST